MIGVAPVDADINERRDRHTADGAEHGKLPLCGGRQLPEIPFAFHFQPDQQEEDRHQSVGHPMDYIERPIFGHGRTEFEIEERLVGARQRRVGRKQGRGGCCNQQIAGKALMRLNLLMGGCH